MQYLFTEADTRSGQLLTEQTNLFLKKLQKLLSILEILLEDTPDKDTLELKTKVEKLLERVKFEGSLNAGGKFEWVDSVLVKVFAHVKLCFSFVVFIMYVLFSAYKRARGC